LAQQIKTAFTERFGIDHPIMLAPMDKVSGGALAAAVSEAGGLGMIGGGYGDESWLCSAIEQAGNHPVGIGFITWSVLNNPQLVDMALRASPAMLMVSFGDASEIIDTARKADVPCCWQIHRLEQARQAIAADADVIVVQGQEAGGHGMDRGLISLLPAVRDLAGPDQLLLAAGGIADGRGLAAALMLGADGVMMGTRFWASEEADGMRSAKEQIVKTAGDDTVRTKVFDIARNVDWPFHFTGRVARNAFTDQWHGNISTLQQQAQEQRQRYAASDEEDYRTRVLIAGEASDMIHSIEPAAAIVESAVTSAAALLRDARRFCID
jgi:nitronate monooxygenase